MTRFSFTRYSLAALACLALAACAKKDAAPAAEPAAVAPLPPPAPTVTMVDLGRHIGSNSRVSDTTSVFGVRDTLYVAVVTEHAEMSSTVTALWTYQTGQRVDSSSHPIARTDATNPVAVTEFHLTKKSGWPKGKYKVEVFLDGKSASTRDFEVK